MNQWDSFHVLVTSFNRRVSDLKQLSLLRSNDGTVNNNELQEIESMVTELELQLQHVRNAVQHEVATIPKANALLPQLQQQQRHLQHISSHLPPHLPAAQTSQITGSEDGSRPSMSHSQDKDQEERDPNTKPPPTTSVRNGEGATASSKVSKKAQPVGAPRNYVTVAELQSVSNFMTRRLTLEKVNNAVDELANLADANMKVIQSTTQKNSRLKMSEKDLNQANQLKDISKHQEIKGRPFILDSDMKTGVHLKLDHSGKTLISVLRQLSRVGEIRVQVSDGSWTKVYMML